MRKPLPDGRLALRLTGLELLKLLVAFIPPPYANIVRYHGVFGPAAKLRGEVTGKHSGLPPDLAEVRASIPAIAAHEGPSLLDKPINKPRTDWASLLQRVFGIDVLCCGKCSGRIRLIALIDDRDVARKILLHLGLPADEPDLPPARAPPGQQDFVFEAA